MDIDTSNHDRLINDCIRGQSAAWDALVKRYARLVESIPRRYRFTDADCEDVAQAVFIKVFQNLERLRDNARLSSWLITTAHRESWRVGRKSGRYTHLDETIEDLGSPRESDVEQWERQHIVHQALTNLGGKCEGLLKVLFFAKGEISYDQISQDLSIPIGSIGPTRARCLKKLAAHLEALGFTGDELG